MMSPSSPTGEPAPRRRWFGIERPAQDPAPGGTPRSLVRPSTVTIGCVMAWLGAAFLIISGIGGLLVTRDSPGLEDVKPEDLDDAVTFAHASGGLSVIVAAMLVFFAIAAFRGRRWGATGLLWMLIAAVLITASSVLAGALLVGIGVITWSVSSATLVRTRATSKAWYDAIEKDREATR